MGCHDNRYGDCLLMLDNVYMEVFKQYVYGRTTALVVGMRE